MPSSDAAKEVQVLLGVRELKLSRLHYGKILSKFIYVRCFVVFILYLAFLKFIRNLCLKYFAERLHIMQRTLLLWES